METKRNVVAAEVAEQEFARWAEALDLDIAPEGMNEEDRRSFSEQKRLLVHAIVAGRLTFNSDGLAVYQTRDELNAITFREPTGEVVIKSRAPSEAERVMSFAMKMTGEIEARFTRMSTRDYKVCTAIVTLLLAAR